MEDESYAGYSVYVFGYAGWSDTESTSKYLLDANCTVVLNDLYNATSSERFLRIVETLNLLGIQVTPPDLCIDCLIRVQHFTWAEIVKTKSVPLAGFFCDGKLTAITIGITELESIGEVLNATDNNNARVFAFECEYSLSDENVQLGLEKLFLGELETLNSASSLLLPISLLALADSVNPCTFAVFTALLLIALHSLGRKKAFFTGFSFIIAIFTCYFVLGLGVIQVFAAVPHVSKIVAIIGLTVGAYSVARGLKPSFRSPIPKLLRRFIEDKIGRSYASLVASFALGAVASFTLLPCSGGPYIVGVGLLSTLNNPVHAYSLLIVYNAIFVTPLLIILLAVLSSRSYVLRIKSLRSKRLGLIELISGLLLVAACIYLLLS